MVLKVLISDACSQESPAIGFQEWAGVPGAEDDAEDSPPPCATPGGGAGK